MSTRRVLIRTIPPTSNANYGGLLQAWALQQFLSDHSILAIVDSSRPLTNARLRRAPRVITREVAVRILPKGLMPPRVVRSQMLKRASRPLLRFAVDQIETASVLNLRGNIRRRFRAMFDAYLVGSDQVWRPEMSDVPLNLFDFVAPSDSAPRISYAASFGTDTREFDERLIRYTRPLARRLSSISVRERSAVDLVRDYWGIHAETHIDPTLLLPRERYRLLFETTEPPVPAGSLVDYVLDDNPAVRSVIGEVSGHWGGGSFSIIPGLPEWRDFRRNQARFDWASVEQWLKAFDSAGFVVTDSFHGTAFAILNNVPFISVDNPGRGSTRFRNLLETFGLQDRLVRPGDRVPRQLVRARIDWDSVNRRLDYERERSTAYLLRALGVGAK